MNDICLGNKVSFQFIKTGNSLPGGRGWIRTTEAEKRQIYSLFPLAARELFLIMELVNGLEPLTC